MIDNTLDSLDFTDWIWGFQLNLSSIIIPKNLVAATRGNTTLLIFNANSLSGGLLSIFSLNCRRINANWDSLNQLIYNMTTEHCCFDFIGLTEVFKFNDDFNFSIQGYHAVEYNTRDNSDDGHGGVGIYVNSDMSYFRRDDLSIFIPHVIETLFIEVKLNQTKSIILGVMTKLTAAC